MNRPTAKRPYLTLNDSHVENLLQFATLRHHSYCTWQTLSSRTEIVSGMINLYLSHSGRICIAAEAKQQKEKNSDEEPRNSTDMQ